jgi:sulfane dehydrogenase subunit SoxC
MENKRKGRRQFLKNSAALGLTAGLVKPSFGQALHPDVISVTETRARGLLSKYEDAHRVRFRSSNNPNATALTPLQDLNGIITPSELHFVVDHENGVLLDINPDEYRLQITGMVDNPLEFTLDDLKRMPSTSGIYALTCGSNGSDAFRAGAKTVQQTHGRTSTSEWSGVAFKTLLEEAGVQKGAKWVIAMAADPSNHVASFPMEKAMDGMTMAAYAQNGESIRIDQGYPARVVAPGYTGRWLVKWLTQLYVTDDTYVTRQDGMNMEDRMPDGRGFLMATDKTRYFRFESTARSVITFPSGGQKLPGLGFYEIRGLAWTGGTVKRVEVSTDGGETWNDAKLQDPILAYAHTRFRMDWKWDGKECIIQSRCTDEKGYVQPTVDEVQTTWGVDSSSECFKVMGELCNQVPRDTHNSFIMSWKIAANGEITNPMRELYPNGRPESLGHYYSGGHAFFEEDDH